MSLLYSLISKNFNLVLVEYTEHTGNFQQITRILLYKLKEKHSPIGIIKYNKYLYSYITEGNLIYLCISDTSDNGNDIQINDNNYLEEMKNELNIIFSFLMDLKSSFFSQYEDIIDQLKSYETTEFAKNMNNLMNYYNNNPKTTKNGFPIENFFEENQNLKIDNNNNYFDSNEFMNIIVIKDDFLKKETIDKKNPMLTSYMYRKKLIEHFKICLKIILAISIFFFFIFLLLYFFGSR